MTHAINWTRAIASNREALQRIAGEITTLMAVALTGTPELWPHQIQAMVRRLLRPAESALRRLILIMARDVNVKLPPRRPMPRGLKIQRKSAGRISFRLYDTRIRLTVQRDPKPPAKGPRIHVFVDRGPLVPLALAQPSQAKSKTNPIARLSQRCAAFTSALATLPQQAKRMALWRLRREAKTNVKFKSPIRPGPPPGHQKRPRFEIDRVLAICHGLAHEALYANSS